MDLFHGLLLATTVALGIGLFLALRSGASARVEAVRLDESEEQARREAERARSEAESAARDAERLQTELDDAKARAEESGERVLELSNKLAALNERLDAAEQARVELLRHEERVKETFESLSGKTLRANQEALSKFLTERLKDADSLSQAELDKRKQAVEAMVKPITETLAKTTERLTQLDERVKASGQSSDELRDETARLAKALSRPEIRGQYGEIQLRRVAELAGMTGYCDFDEQFSSRDDEGQLSRPDMVVRLPNDRVVAVDAKTNTYAYLEAVNADSDEQREHHLDRFARHVADQAKKLGDKKYWSAFDHSPEFVVMFVPGDHFIDAALSRRPDLLEQAALSRVILASPSTLIGLLRAVAVGWREHTLAEEAQELFKLGKELHERAATAFEHAGKLGDSIRQSVERYNKLVGSIDSRLLPTLKRFEQAGAGSGKELIESKPVAAEPRLLGFGDGE